MPVSDLYGSPMDAASSVLGRGEKEAAVRDFLTTGGANLDPATQAWCAAFVNASLGHAGQQGTGKMNARSFMDWGQAVEQPQRGDVAVFSRGDPNGWQGHVGFFDSIGPDGKIQVLGGNQGDSVSMARMDPTSLLGFRRAAGGAGGAGTGFNPNAGQGLEDLFLPPTAAVAAPPRDIQAEKAAEEKKRREALFGALPGLYG